MTNAATSNQGSIGAGQQDPNSSTSGFNMHLFLISQMIGRVGTMKLVKVLKVTEGEGGGDVKAAGTVDVLPLVNQIDGNGNSTPHGTIYGLPWTRMQGGKNCVVCDPVAGDIGFIVISDRDISAVKKTKKQSNPGSRRKFNPSDGIYIGGALNVAPEQYLQFTAEGVRVVDKNGNSIALSQTGVEITPAPGMPVIVNGNLFVEGGIQLTGTFKGKNGAIYAGDIETSGGITAGKNTGDQVTLQNHTHQYDRPIAASTPAQTVKPTAGT